MNGDGNFGSLCYSLMHDLHMPGIIDVIRRKAIAAMKFHRDRRYYFSDREITFNLIEGRSIYRPGDGSGLPRDLVEIAGKVIWVHVDGSADMRQACHRVNSTEWEEGRAGWGTSTSHPEEWDFRLGGLRFSPTPHSSADAVELRYLTDLRVPRVLYDTTSTTYKYFHPDTGVELNTSQLDTWTNDWLTQEKGEAAIRARTTYELRKTYLSDPEGANEALGYWLEMISQLENETESKTGAVYQLEGSILD